MSEDVSPQTDSASSSSINFVAFVLSLAHTAAVHFGDIPDPVSGDKGEVNLAAAQQMIDILSLLEEKTRGNLTEEEAAMLQDLLSEAQMAFVKVARSMTGGGA